jgi:hypothetical protein
MIVGKADAGAVAQPPARDQGGAHARSAHRRGRIGQLLVIGGRAGAAASCMRRSPNGGRGRSFLP